MALVVPDLGEQELLKYLVGLANAGNLSLRLYTNNVDLGLENFTTGSFTEPTAAGYSSKTLTAGSAGWSNPTTNSSGITTISYSSGVTFAFTAAVDVRGYFVTTAGGVTLWAEEFPSAPFSLPSSGGDIIIRPQLQLN